MYALCNVDLFESINLKCDPDRAIELREMHASVTPGFHMNKKHWNTVLLDGAIPDQLIFSWTDHSYELVRNHLPAKVRKNL